MSCPICGTKVNSPEELMAHFKEVHNMNIDLNLDNLMKGMSEVFGKIFSGKTELPSDAAGSKELDPTLFFGKMMEQLFSVFSEGMKGLQSDSSDESSEEMPNPFVNMMQNMFGAAFQPDFESDPEPKDESEPESDILSSSTNENDVQFQEDSIEIPFTTDDDEKKKDKKDNNE